MLYATVNARLASEYGFTSFSGILQQYPGEGTRNGFHILDPCGESNPGPGTRERFHRKATPAPSKKLNPISLHII